MSHIAEDKHKLLVLLKHFKEKMPLVQVMDCLKQTQCSHDELFEFVQLLEKWGFRVEFNQETSDFIKVMPARPLVVEVPVLEWIMQQIDGQFPWVEKWMTKNIQDHYPEYSITSSGTIQFENRPATPEEVIERAILEHCFVYLDLKENRSQELYPHRLVYLDDELTLVGEAGDGLLTHRNLDSILSVKLDYARQYTPKYSHMEIDDFILAARAITGKECRLVLKILSPHDVNLNPRYYYFGSPYVTTSLDGSLIWAASVELAPQLFDWLFEIKQHIEILDPSKMKSEFEEFCHKKVKKKAS